VEVVGSALDAELVERACVLAAATAGVEDGHVAVTFVGADEIAALNASTAARRGRPTSCRSPSTATTPSPSASASSATW